MARGDPNAQAPFHRWAQLVKDTWGADPATSQNVREAQRLDPILLAGTGTNPEMQAYVQQGMVLYTSNLNLKSMETMK